MREITIAILMLIAGYLIGSGVEMMKRERAPGRGSGGRCCLMGD